MPNEVTVEQAVDEFATWQDGRPDANVDYVGAAQFLLDYKRDFLADDPYLWRQGDISQLLLEILPRKLSDPTPEDGITVNGLRAYLEFVDAEKRFSNGSRQHADLVSELDQVAPHHPAAMHDKSKWGMAKSIYMPAREQGIDLSSQEALDRYVAQYNSQLPGNPLLGNQPLGSRPVVEQSIEPAPDKAVELFDRIAHHPQDTTSAIFDEWVNATGTNTAAEELIGMAAHPRLDRQAVRRLLDNLVTKHPEIADTVRLQAADSSFAANWVRRRDILDTGGTPPEDNWTGVMRLTSR